MELIIISIFEKHEPFISQTIENNDQIVFVHELLLECGH